METTVPEFITQSPSTSWRNVGGYTMIVDHTSRKMLTLSDVAGLIWVSISEWTTFDEIVRCILNEFDVDRTTAIDDASNFLSELIDHGLIVSSNPDKIITRNNASPSCAMEDFRDQIPIEVKQYCESRYIPLVAFLELTEKCNLRCVHCYNSPSKRKELSTDEIYGVIDQLAEMGTFDIVLTGGEPMLHKDILDILAHAKRRHFCISIKTNGTLIDEYIARKLSEFLVVEVHVSLYSMRKGEHELITGCRGSHLKTLNGIEALRHQNMQLRINCPVTKLNYRNVKEVKQFADSIGATCGFDPIITPKTDCNLTPTSLRLEEEHWHFLHDNNLVNDVLYPDSGDIHDLTLRKKIDATKNVTSEPFCGAGTTSLGITSYGDVLPCVIYPRTMGNIREESISKIWSKQKQWRSIRDFSAKDFTECKACEMKEKCLRCPAVALSESGSMSNKLPVFCATANHYYK